MKTVCVVESKVKYKENWGFHCAFTKPEVGHAFVERMKKHKMFSDTDWRVSEVLVFETDEGGGG